MKLLALIASAAANNEVSRRWGSDPKSIVRCPIEQGNCFEPRIVGIPESYQPLLNSNFYPNYYSEVEVPEGQLMPIGSKKLELSNPRFSDDNRSRCPKGVAASWQAKYAIDGVKYCSNKQECDSPYRLAHSAHSTAIFTADFNSDLDIGRV